ncbi:MAG: hypothetical protein AAF919_12130 [Pseudomonadota bacterium]
MKTLISATVIAALTSPAFADPNAAIAHFNQDLNPNHRIATVTDAPVTVSTRSGVRSDAIARFNDSAERNSDRIVVDRATSVSGTPRYGAAFFDAIRAEDND